MRWVEEEGMGELVMGAEGLEWGSNTDKNQEEGM